MTEEKKTISLPKKYMESMISSLFESRCVPPLNIEKIIWDGPSFDSSVIDENTKYNHLLTLKLSNGDKFGDLNLSIDFRGFEYTIYSEYTPLETGVLNPGGEHVNSTRNLKNYFNVVLPSEAKLKLLSS